LRLEKSVREDGVPLAAMVCDLDHFKQINDRYGHATGDAVLKAFGQLIRNSARVDDLAVRWGGEEFVVLLPGANLEKVSRRAEEVRQALESTRLSPQRVAVTVSIGVGQMSQVESLQQLLHRVDKALYEAKAKGRNRVVRSHDAPKAAIRSA